MRKSALCLLSILCILLLFAARTTYAQGREVDDAVKLYREGLQAQLDENPHLAVEKFRAALALNPNYFEPLVGLSESFFQLEEYEEALIYLDRAREMDTGNIDLMNLEGEIRIALNMYTEARELFLRVLAAEPHNLAAQFGLAELDIAMDRKQQANRRYLNSLKVEPYNAKALLSLAQLSADRGDRPQALSYIELALKQNANNPQAHYEAARFALQENLTERAQVYLETALALREDYGQAQRLLAQVYLLRRRPADAVELLRSLVAVSRSDAAAWYTLGLSYDSLGRTDEAVSSLARALRLRMDDEIARLALENILLEQMPIGDPLRVRYAEYHLARGALFEEKNLLQKAALEYRSCLRLDPESKQGRLAYARVFELSGFPGKSLQELEVLRKLGKEDARILDKIEMETSAQASSLAAEWGTGQFEVEKDSFDISLYYLENETRTLHPRAGEYLHDFFLYQLLRFENLNILKDEPGTESFADAFRKSREKGADFFMLLGFEESERSFTVRLDLYLARTGSLLASTRVYRTGNDRVRDSFLSLSTRFHDWLPMSGTLIAREFDRGLINLGRLDGVSVEDRFSIVRQGRVVLSHEEVGYAAEEEDILGELTVTRVDENIAEGLITRDDFFDLINLGDRLIQPAETRPAPAEPGREEDGGLLRRLFRLFRS
jgi:tetratricopeptide (TPR) repeat protein